MQTRLLDVRGQKVELIEAGAGEPVLYLHDIWDVHTAQAGMFPFHEQLATFCRVTIPAHPGCGQSSGISEISDIEDLAFHYFDVFDALGIKSASVVGTGIGGWIAAEMAVRNPERFKRLALIGAAGVQLPDAQIADLFMYSQNRDGGIMDALRELLFADSNSSLANRIVPDGRVGIADEVRRYKSLTLAGRVGWEPPYLHNRKLLSRLRRIACPTLLIWGEQDRLIPLTNGAAYATHIPGSKLIQFAGCGHSVILEKPDECRQSLQAFFTSGALATA